MSPIVRELIAREGSARVFVQLRLPGGAHVPEGYLPPAAVATQRADIAATATQVLRRLGAANHRLLHRYESIPLMAIEVDAGGLAQLEASTFWVRDVVEDAVNQPSLMDSVPLIGGPVAWGSGYDGSGVVVAILDTGVESTHPFLAGKVVEEACFSANTSRSQSLCPNGSSSQLGAGSAVPCTVNGSCAHGTHVAGIAAGNGAGAGVTFSGVAKGAQIMAVQIYAKFTQAADCNNSPPCVLAWTSDIVAGLDRVNTVRATRNIASANLSLGGGLFSAPCDTEPEKQIIDTLRSAKIATVIAAGNDGSPTALESPGCISSAISVGSTTKSDGISSFSNVASFMSLFAPGSSIYSSVPGATFAFKSGTSMATPHVTGAWAVLKQAAPTASVDQILSALQATGVPITDTRSGTPVTKSRIRLDLAVAQLAPQPPSGAVNVALQSNGGVATASSTYSAAGAPDGANNGDRAGINWGAGGGWNDGTANQFPDWLQITFNGPKTISEIDVFTLQDTWWAPSTPTPTMTFTQYGVTAFDVQYWTGSAWVTVPNGSITGNNLVWRKVTFPAVTTDRIRIVVNGGLAGYARITEVEAWSSTAPAPPAGAVNVALQGNGGVATASSMYSSAGAPDGANNGDRAGINWGAGGGWNDGTADQFPDWLQITFNGPKTISEIDVFTLQDTWWAPSTPTPTMTFTQYGVTAFDVQYWTGSAWVTVPNGSITGNNLVWRKVTFPAVTTDRIRIVVNAGLGGYARITEVEAWTASSSPPPGINVALQGNGGVATASSTYSAAGAPDGANNGDRAGVNWGAGGGWNDGTASQFPDWLQITFNGLKTISEIDVFTLQDAWFAPATPTPTMTFTKWGVTAFDVQYWTGSAWVTVPGGSITGNNLVWRQVTFSPVTTDRIRILVNAGLGGYSRITEVEAWGQ